MLQRRHHIEQIISLEDRLIGEAGRLRDKAEPMQPGSLREHVLRQPRRHETMAIFAKWPQSPGLAAEMTARSRPDDFPQLI